VDRGNAAEPEVPPDCPARRVVGGPDERLPDHDAPDPGRPRRAAVPGPAEGRRARPPRARLDVAGRTRALYENVFKPALVAAGLPVSASATEDALVVRGVRLHDPRHSFTVLSLSAGEHYMMVSKWLGHANFTITLNVYGNYIPKDECGKAHPVTRPPSSRTPHGRPGPV